MTTRTPALPSVENAAELCDGLRRLFAQGQETAAQLERGQAESPLSRHFAHLAAAFDQAACTVLLLGLDPDGTAALCRWARVERPTFAAGAELVEATVPGDEGLRVLILASAATLAANPVLLSRLLARANVLALASATTPLLDTTTQAAVDELAGGVLAAWAVPVVAADSGPPSLAILLERRSTLRQGLASLHLARRGAAAVALLEDCLTQESIHQAARRVALARRLARLNDPDGERSLRETAEAVRRQLDDASARLDLTFASRHRERTLATSPYLNEINNFLEDLAADDVHEEVAGNTIQLTLAPTTVLRADRLLCDLAHADVRADLQTLAAEGSAAADAADARLAGVTGTALRRPAAAQETAAWEALQRAIHLDLRSRAELPRRGLFDLLSHGRRPVMIATMTLSLVGAAFGTGVGARTLLAPALLVLFIASLGWSVRDFRREAHERRQKELERLRETLGTEMRRQYEQAQRQWQEWLTRQLRELHRELARAADEQLRAHSLAVNQQSARERKDLQDRTALLDSRLRELHGLAQQAERLRTQAAEVTQTLELAVRPAGGTAGAR